MADNATIIIGARDQASKILQDIASNTQNLTSKINTMATAAQAATAVLLPIAALAAGVQALRGLASTATAATDAYNKQTRAARGMSDATLEVTAQWQKSLGVGDEVSLQLIRQAQMLGMTEEQAVEATKAALGLATAQGISHEQALRKVHKAMQDGTDITAVANNGLAEMQLQMNSLEGVQTRASNSMGDFMEVVGAIIAPIQMMISHGLAVAAEVLQSVFAPAAQKASDILSNMGPILDWITRQIVSVITFIEIGFKNLPAVFEFVKLRVQLFFTSFVEDMKHAFLVTAPQILEWFGRNWTNLLSDVFQAIVVMTTNRLRQLRDLFRVGLQAVIDLAKWFSDWVTSAISEFGPKVLNFLNKTLVKIGEAFTKTWNWIVSWFSSGSSTAISSLTDTLQEVTNDVVAFMAAPPRSVGSYAQQFGEILSRNMLEGFEASTEPLPELVARELTDGEREMQARMGEIGDDLGAQFQDAFQARMDAVTQGFQETVGNLGTVAGSANIPELGGGRGGSGSLTAKESRLLTRGSGEDPQQQLVKLTQRQTKLLERNNAIQERIARRQEAREERLNLRVVN